MVYLHSTKPNSMETNTFNILDQEEFSAALKAKISDRLISYFGDKMKTDAPVLERKSYASTFYCRFMGKCTPIMGDYDFAGYKVDDSHGYIRSEEFMVSERNRLLSDVDNCENIVLFLADKFYF
jgi:hypothetical protein